MAEADQTFTMDETTLEAGQLSEVEQESLRVGEQMEQEQQQLLAGKYQNAEQLEKAYVELEKKLGGNEPDAETVSETKTEEKTEEKDSQETTDVLDKLWEERSDGFKDETLKELAETNPGELAKAYLQYRNQNQQAKGLSEKDVTDLKGVIGGDDNYNNLIGWAEQNMSKEEQAMYDSIIDRGDKVACYFAIQYAFQQYQDAVGKDGTLITGKPPSSSGNQFRSQAELVKAMADTRYENDPAYRQDVMEKLTRSQDVNF